MALHITNYTLQKDHGKHMPKNKKEEHNKKENDKPKEIVMMAYCPEGEDKIASDQCREEILVNLGKGLGDRGNVVMTRLDDTDLKQIDALVEVDAFKSRSEAAAFFIKEGIQARKDLFEKVMPTVDKIRELKEQAKRELNKRAKE
jgi:Arc/MetJ-type ribon-helix-helix transcriptional regulator